MAHRFFVDFPLTPGTAINLPTPIAHQASRVLRLRPGATITLLDGGGWEYSVELTDLAAQSGYGLVGAGRLVESEPRIAVTLYAAPLKGDHFAYTLQKATEIGAAAFVPIVTRRTVAEGSGDAKVERWRRIVREAAEQSGRGRLPSVEVPIPFATACQRAANCPALIPWEEATDTSVAREVAGAREAIISSASLGLFVGPEGGFAPEEIDLARSQGITPVTLGRRILRAETASAVALTLALATLGEMER